MHQPVFAQPLMSWRRKTSPKTVNRNQNHRIQQKKISIDHITWPNVQSASNVSS